MKRYLMILLGVLLCAGAFTPLTTAKASSVYVEIGDRPYYSRGPYYRHRGHRWVWIPGHWAWRHHHRFWIHGYYVRRY